MLEVHIPLPAGESMMQLRDRARAFCDSNRIPFEQAGQIPQALALFVENEETRELVKQGLAPPAKA